MLIVLYKQQETWAFFQFTSCLLNISPNDCSFAKTCAGSFVGELGSTQDKAVVKVASTARYLNLSFQEKHILFK